MNLCYYHKYPDISPTLFVRTPDGEMNPSKPGMTDYLLDIIKDTPYFFDFNCYDSHVFNLKEINSFFSTQGVDLCFQESKVKNHSLDAHSKNRKLKSENQHILFLMEFRKDDPLALAIEIRNKDWAGYIYDDKATRANQESIIADLKSRGLSTKQAECIELVACPIKDNVALSSAPLALRVNRPYPQGE
ncbi:hypothetical protein SODG_003836 [Sodalis praecaptivus]